MTARVSESPAEATSGPPVTGDLAVDEALARLAELDEIPLSEHHDVLASAHEVLRTALEAGSGEPPAGGR